MSKINNLSFLELGKLTFQLNQLENNFKNNDFEKIICWEPKKIKNFLNDYEKSKYNLKFKINKLLKN